MLAEYRLHLTRVIPDRALAAAYERPSVSEGHAVAVSQDSSACSMLVGCSSADMGSPATSQHRSPRRLGHARAQVVDACSPVVTFKIPECA